MYDVSHINTTWESKEVASHKAEDHHFGGGGGGGELTPIDTMIYHFTLLRVIQGIKLK